MTATATVYVRGTCLCRGKTPARPAILPPLLRRRTSPLTRQVARVLEQLSERTGVDLAAVPIVHASGHGEIAVTMDLLRDVLDPAADVSPTRFHNSVHNTAVGYVSIACRNRFGHTAVAAGPDTFAAGLLEAAALLARGAGRVVLVCADEPVPPPLGPRPPFVPTAVAFDLTGSAEGARARVDLSGPHAAPPDAAPAADTDPVAPAVALHRALAEGHAGPLAASSAPPWAQDDPSRPVYACHVHPLPGTTAP